MEAVLQKALLRVPEAAEVAGCKKSTAYELIRQGEWPTVQTPYGLRVPADGLQEWISKQPRA